MVWRRLGVARFVPGLIVGCLAVGLTPGAFAQSPEPIPTGAADSAAVDDFAADDSSANVLEALRDGRLNAQVRGDGNGKIRVHLKNVSPRRLNVVLPPGLVAASATGQIQSMGLGSINNSLGSFGRSRSLGENPGPERAELDDPTAGFRSVPAMPPKADPDDHLAIPAGKSIEMLVPAVCLNFGKPTPTSRDVFQLVAVDEYSSDPRVVAALKGLNRLGTSVGVAQAVMWHVCNGMTFEQLATAGRPYLNLYEVGLASHFVKVLDRSGSSGLIDADALTRSRLLLEIQGEKRYDEAARRIESESAEARLLGLPALVVSSETQAPDSGLLMLVNVQLGRAQKDDQTRIQVTSRFRIGQGPWQTLGQFSFNMATGVDQLNGQALIKALDRELARNFVVVRNARKGKGVTSFQIVNRLPFSVTTLSLRAGESFGSPEVVLEDLGVGPRRQGQANVPADSVHIERVELNGL